MTLDDNKPGLIIGVGRNSMTFETFYNSNHSDSFDHQILHMMSPTTSPTPALDIQPSRRPEWNSVIMIPLIIICAFVVLFSYYGILKRVCSALNTLTLGRNPVKMRCLNGSNLQDPSFQTYSQGLDSRVMHSLPITQFKNKKGENATGNNIDCAVCLGEFAEGEWLKYLPNCTHVFHDACFDTWFQTHSSCPLCRSHVYDLSQDYSVSIDTLLETLMEDFFHERAEHYQMIRSQILCNSERVGPGPSMLSRKTLQSC